MFDLGSVPYKDSDELCIACVLSAHTLSVQKGSLRYPALFDFAAVLHNEMDVIAAIQLAEGRPLAEHLGIDPDRPDSFAFLASGQAYVKSEAVLRIARELPRWQWTWIFQFIPRVIRDATYDLVARNRYRWFGRRDACILPNSDRSWPS